MTKKIATFKNPSIEACIKGLFRFQVQKEAKAKLKSISDNFELSKKFEQTDSKITLWVKGYNISDSEKEKGYLGNFADIYVDKISDKLGDFYTLKMKKRKISLKFHPQKKKVESSHPNWGHPILRDIKKGKIFNDIQDAIDELQRLHIQFPNTSIPTGDKLFIIIYEKIEGKRQKTHKYILQVKPSSSDSFVIDYRLNKQSETKDKIKKIKKKSQDKDIKGFFTAKEKAKAKITKNDSSN
jgi:hypothetical protein